MRNEVSPTVPTWQGRRYDITLMKSDGKWKIVGMQEVSVIIEATPTPTPRADADSVGGQCLRRRVDACLPHEQGADRLRFVPVGAVKRIHGGRLRSRSLPPAAVGGRGRRENGQVPQKGILKGLIP